MIYIDTLLANLVNYNFHQLENSLPAKDFNVLRSLSTNVNNHLFITENQSRLLLKILQENQKKIEVFSDEITDALSNITWSKAFRQIEQIRKMHLVKNVDSELVIQVDFTFNSEIRKIMTGLTKTVENLITLSNGKTYLVDLTEKNIVYLVDALAPFDFDIDETIKNHYSTIKSWSKNEVESQFLLTNIEYKNFQKAITDDLGIETSIDQNIINDRSVRYQYFTKNAKNFGENLTEIIANRDKTRVWIDKSQHSLTNVVASLIELKRLPVLVVFDTVMTVKYLENLEILSEALEKNGINDNVGIYFRLPNDDTYKKFNQTVADNSYNKRLDDQLEVAGVMSGKIPKFFLTTAWRPMSVIALDTKMGLRHGKTAVYANCCDLIVEWADQPTMIEQKVLPTWR
jgi:hypothetical protein